MEIKKIKAEDTWIIRHEVMWPHMPFDFVKVEGDQEAIHFGLFLDNHLVSIVSLFVTGNTVQFRKLATLHKYQGKGYGSTLLKYIFIKAQEMGVEKIWCNARKVKAPFYMKLGMEKTGCQFIKDDMEYVIMEKNIDL